MKYPIGATKKNRACLIKSVVVGLGFDDEVLWVGAALRILLCRNAENNNPFKVL